MLDERVIPQLILIQFDLEGRLTKLSPAAESWLGKSQKALIGAKVEDALPVRHPARETITLDEDQSHYDLRFVDDEGRFSRFDLHLYVHENEKLLFIYPRSKVETINQTHTASQAARRSSALSATLAHEIRNPLGAISGAAQLLGESVSASDQAFVNMICEETDRIGRLVSEFEDMAGDSPTNLSSVNIHEVLDRAIRAAEAGYGRNLRFVRDYDPSLPHIAADQDRLARAFGNLLKNASEAVQNRHTHQISKGKITISTRYRGGISRVQKLPIELRIRDNGGGIDEGLIAEIFEPFFTTKPQGTGIGLSVVASTIEEIGGVIEVQNTQSETDKGIEFIILFPAWNELES